jgi:hypothetical protein
VSIPAALSKPGEAPLYATLQAPSSAKWFAIGFGSQMKGSLMLVAWPWNDKVVVSSRLATYLVPYHNDTDSGVIYYLPSITEPPSK